MTPCDGRLNDSVKSYNAMNRLGHRHRSIESDKFNRTFFYRYHVSSPISRFIKLNCTVGEK